MAVERAPYINYTEITSYQNVFDNGSEIPVFMLKTNNEVALADINNSSVLKFISYGRFKRYFSISDDEEEYNALDDSIKEIDNVIKDFFVENSMFGIDNEYGLTVPFKRPDYLATDTCGSNEVIQHAWSFFENKGKHYNAVLLLQPTSPFRKVEFLNDAVALYDDSIDMVTSVMSASCNPYYDGFEENEEGILTISKGDGTIERRQDAPNIWQLNGSIYVINPKSLMEKGLSHFSRIRKYVMPNTGAMIVGALNIFFLSWSAFLCGHLILPQILLPY